MLISKELSDIALNITEPEYRQMPELSYSTLSTYERVGFNGLDHLFDKLETPSLLLGSLVDTAITGGQEEFDSLYFIADFSLGEKEQRIADYLFNQFSTNYNSLEDLPSTYILDAANTFEFQKNWKDETRVRVLTERCSHYYQLKYAAAGKTVVDTDTYNAAMNMVRALKESPATSGYFADNQEDSPIRRYYQLKFRADLEGVGYRGMMDLIIVDYFNKIIYPCDLKTAGIPEWDFEDNFLKFHYYHQARLYWRLLRYNLDQDDYFKDFELKNFKFIVVNRFHLTPLVWEFPLTKEYGTLVTENGEEIRDPFEIGKELRYYLDIKPMVPKGINRDGINTIKCLRKKGEE